MKKIVLTVILSIFSILTFAGTETLSLEERVLFQLWMEGKYNNIVLDIESNPGIPYFENSGDYEAWGYYIIATAYFNSTTSLNNPYKALEWLDKIEISNKTILVRLLSLQLTRANIADKPFLNIEYELADRSLRAIVTSTASLPSILRSQSLVGDREIDFGSWVDWEQYIEILKRDWFILDPTIAQSAINYNQFNSIRISKNGMFVVLFRSFAEENEARIIRESILDRNPEQDSYIWQDEFGLWQIQLGAFTEYSRAIAYKKTINSLYNDL